MSRRGLRQSFQEENLINPLDDGGWAGWVYQEKNPEGFIEEKPQELIS